jgi:hypothetical protein
LKKVEKDLINLAYKKEIKIFKIWKYNINYYYEK